MTEHDQTTHVLVCAECATEAPPGAVGWQAYLTVGDEDAKEIEEVAVYCPACAAREFGGRHLLGRASEKQSPLTHTILPAAAS